MRLVAIALIAGCSSMPDVNGNTLGESGTAKLSVAPGQTTVNALGFDLVVSNTGDGASGAVGARLVDHDAAWFAITHTDCTELQPGGTCAVGVVFAPGSAATSGTTTLEIDDDNERKATAGLDGKIMPAIRWLESAAPMSAQVCTVAGPSETVSTTIHLLYANVAISNVQIDVSDGNFHLVNGCSGAMGTSGSCDVTIQIARGSDVTNPAAQATITATVGGLTAKIATSYQLATCDLVLSPEPLVLDVTTPSGVVTLTNVSATNSHRIASEGFGTNSTISVVDTDCATGDVLAPGDSCSASFVYTPSAAPQNDPGIAMYTVTTNDAAPLEPISVTGHVQVALANSHIHFEKDTYTWADVAVGSLDVPMQLKVLTDNGVAIGGPLTFAFTNHAWMVDAGLANTCSASFQTECQVGVDFGTTSMTGSFNGLIVAKGPGGQFAYAVLKAKVN